MKHILFNTFTKATAMTAVAFVSIYVDARAMPASPFPRVMEQPDGSFIEVLVQGDEHSWTLTTPDGNYTLRRDAQGYLRKAEIFDRKTPAGITKAPARSKLIDQTTAFPAYGQQRALAILVEFPETDQHPEGRRFGGENPRQLFEDYLNKEGYDHEGATGSVRDYFLNSSNGKFDLTFDVFGPITLSKDLSHYTSRTNGDNLNAWEMVVEGCMAIDHLVDFNDYDRDHNGLIDNVYVFYAGEGAATGGNPEECIWQHASEIERLSGQQYILDGIRLNRYACSNEYRMVNDDSGALVRRTEGIGTVCHEFSHVLGLPDLYDTMGNGVWSPGLWSLMDTGCHLNDSRTPPQMAAFERMSLGWLEPRITGTSPQSLSLRDISANEAYIVASGGSENEYFLLENRQQQGWDSYLPGHGMLVWHINYMPDYWAANQVNTILGFPGVDIVRADAGHDSAHPFPGTSGITSLTDEGYPNMRSYKGEPANAPITRISEAGGIISFDICRTATSVDRVSGVYITDVTPTSFSAAWDQMRQGVSYIVNVYTGAGVSAEPVGAYNNMPVNTPNITIEGLTPSTRYSITIRAAVGSVSGEPSEAVTVTTPEWSFAYMTPTDVRATDITSDGFIADWHTIDGAIDHAIRIFTADDPELASERVDFSEGLELLPAGWSTNSSMTLSINGYYGEASPALSLPEDYGRIQSPVVPDDITSVSLWYRERSGSGLSRLELSFMVGGIWTDAIVTDLPAGIKQGETLLLDGADIPEGSRAVRVVYRRIDKGTLAIDDINISYIEKQTYTPVDGLNPLYTGSASTTAEIKGLAPESAYYFSVSAIDADNTESRASELTKVTTDATGAIRTVDATDQTPNAVYDLLGRRVNKAGKGIYIIRSGNKTDKITL